MKKVILLSVILLLVLFSVFYIQFRGEIAAAHQRVLEGSLVLSTEYGEIEYAVEGEGHALIAETVVINERIRDFLTSNQ